MNKKIIKSFILYILMWLGLNSLILKEDIRKSLILFIIISYILLVSDLFKKNPKLFKKDLIISEAGFMNNIRKFRTFILYGSAFIGLNSLTLKIDNWKVLIAYTIIYLIIFAFDYFKKDESIE